MSKGDFSKMIKKFQKGLSKHSPEILMGIGIIGSVTSTILAVNATPKALELIKKKKEESKYMCISGNFLSCKLIN